MRLLELPKGETTNILAYGGAGSSKTVFCGTAGDRTLYFDCGNSITTLQSEWFQKVFGPSNPDVHRMYESQLPDVAKAFDYITDAIDDYLKNKPNEFDTVVIDDATGMRKFAMARALEVNADLKRSQTRANLIAKDVDFVIAAVQDYGIEMSAIIWFIGEYTDRLRAAGKSLIMTAHEKIWQTRVRDAQGKIQLGAPPLIYQITPAFTGQKYPDTETGMFDCVWHFEAAGSGNN